MQQDGVADALDSLDGLNALGEVEKCRLVSVGVKEHSLASQSWHERKIKHRSLLGACAQSPNDPKLSDGGGWRAGCMVGGKAAAEAASVTAGAVRCSAWLGVAVIWEL